MMLIHDEPRSTLAGFRLVIPLLFAGMLCGPCGQAIAEVTAVKPVDACAVLTKADVKAVYGSVVGEPNGKSLGRGPFWVSMCNYDNVHTDAPMLSVGLLINAHGATAGPARAYDSYVAEPRRELGNADVPLAIEGLAGPAGWDADTGQLTVFGGHTS